MFKKLRNEFILTNMLTTTAILVIAFVSIFAVSAAGTRRELPPAPKAFNKSNEMLEAFREEIEREREEQLARLGLTLAMVGVSIEILVFVVSYMMAERSVKPVEEAYEKQREFIANASHELKTPIAAVQANFEALGATEQPWTDNIETEFDKELQYLLSNELLLQTKNGQVQFFHQTLFDYIYARRFTEKEYKLLDVLKGQHQGLFSRASVKSILTFLRERNPQEYIATIDQLLYAKDESGKVTVIHCTYDPASKGGNSPDGRKVKGTIHWVSAEHGKKVTVRLYENLINEELGVYNEDGSLNLNPNSLTVLTESIVEPALLEAKPYESFQFVREGFFCADYKDSKPGAPVFNRIVSLKSSFKLPKK